jgi:hypothetical protein
VKQQIQEMMKAQRGSMVGMERFGECTWM